MRKELRVEILIIFYLFDYSEGLHNDPSDISQEFVNAVVG